MEDARQHDVVERLRGCQPANRRLPGEDRPPEGDRDDQGDDLHGDVEPDLELVGQKQLRHHRRHRAIGVGRLRCLPDHTSPVGRFGRIALRRHLQPALIDLLDYHG